MIEEIPWLTARDREECEIMGGNFSRRTAQARETVQVDPKLITRYADAGADHVQLLGTPRAQEAMASEREGIDWLRRAAERVL
jgi:hypothetical protein